MARKPTATLPDTIALVLQGGGALGAYQAGVYQGLDESGVVPQWLGGISITRFGDYTWMWYADIALAGLAAFVNLPIRELPVQKAVPSPA